jgi:hypothetical protein
MKRHSTQPKPRAHGYRPQRPKIALTPLKETCYAPQKKGRR